MRERGDRDKWMEEEEGADQVVVCWPSGFLLSETDILFHRPGMFDGL